MHLLKYSWQFSFKIAEKAARFSFEKPQFTYNASGMSGLYFTCVFCVSVAYFKDCTWHKFKQFFQVTIILN